MTRSLFRFVFCLSAAAALLPRAAHADQWIAPSPEELSMTAQPGAPGAPAVYLFREQITEDNLHTFTVYQRIKVLTEGGKKFGDIEVKYAAGGPADFRIGDISGRTIHPDGSIVPFTGKPYQKLIEKGHGYKYTAKVFSLPDVQVGSIIEYRYRLWYDDHYFVPPEWYIQSELYTRKAHYLWRPTSKMLVTSGEHSQTTSGIAWTPILPPDSKVNQTHVPGKDESIFEVSVHDIPPSPQEEYMPPIASFSYRVLFYYASYRSADEFWKNEGKFWAHKADKFIGPSGEVNAAVKELVLPTDSPEQKLRKIYIAVQKLENTDLTRNRSGAEDKAQGFGEIHSTDDIWRRKRGSSDQLAELFVAMARSAGMKSHLMAVSDRSRRVFYPSFLSLSQLDDNIAIVELNGKEQFFDPGSRFCPFGHLLWKHTMTGGLRQVDGGAVQAITPGENYADSRIQRVANLTIDKQGIATGTVKLTFLGAPALTWRQASLEGDDESLKRDLRRDVEQMLPHGMDVHLTSIDALNDYEQPLVVSFDVKGGLGSVTGKRLFLPGDIFEANSSATFPHEKREVPVYFHFGHMVQDAIRINFPSDFTVESLPASSRIQFQQFANYALTSTAATNNVTIRRNYSLGQIVYLPAEYPQLRSFYSEFEGKDQQSLVLKVQPPLEQKASSATN